MNLTNLKNIFKGLPLRRSGNVIGLLITGKTIVACEIDCDKGAQRLECSAEYTCKGSDILDSSTAADFADFLKANGFKGRKAVVGIQNSQLLVTTVELPSVKDESLINDIVKIGCEQKLKMELSDIAFDYYLANGNTAVVLAILHRYVENMKAFLRKLFINPIYITGITPFIAIDDGQNNTCYAIVLPEQIELTAINDGIIKNVDNITCIDDVDKVISSIKRDMILSFNKSGDFKLRIFDFSGGRNDLANNIEDAFRDGGDFSDVKCTRDLTLTQLAEKIATKAACDRNLPLNMLRSGHIQQNHHDSYRKFLPKIAVAAVVLVLLAGIFFTNWYRNKAQTVNLQAQLDSISAQAAQAEDIIRKIGHVKQWFNAKPCYLEALRQLTEAFPQSNEIWLSTMAVDESFKQVITGKATEEKAILDLLDNLKKTPAFEGVQILYMRKAGKTTEIITFAMSFRVKKG